MRKENAARGEEGRGTTWLQRTMVGAVLVALLAGGYFGSRYFANRGGGPKPPGPPPVTVTATVAAREIWDRRLKAVGTLEAVQGVDVTSEVAGEVVEIAFESGRAVSAGDLLVQLDTSSEKAELLAIEARLKQAERERARSQELRGARAVSQEAYEQATATVNDLSAQAAKQRAIIAKKRIVAPFSGQLGIRRVDLGEYLAPGAAIVTLQQLEPIFVNFDLPEQQAGAVKAGQTVTATVAAYPDKTFTGEISAVNPLIDPSTRSFAVQAKLPNKGRPLRPGMFADVTVHLPGERQVVTLPQTAITFNAYGKSVFFVRPRGGRRARRTSWPGAASSRRGSAAGCASRSRRA